MSELDNARHELFAVLIARGADNAGRAYLKTGYKCTFRAAEVAASRLLRNAEIKSRIAELQKEWAQEAGVTTTDVIRAASAIAFFDIRKLVSWVTTKRGKTKFRLVDSSKLDDMTALAIKLVKVTAYGPEILLHDKSPMIIKIGEHLGMFSGESAEKGNVTYNDTRTMTYIDAPRSETIEEWQARVSARERR